MSKPSGNIDLKQLIAATAQNDEQAFAAFYDATCGKVHDLACYILKDEALAEEVTMDTFLQVWREDENHGDLEEMFMLYAEIRLSGHRLKFGDYCRAEPGSIHEEVVVISDCMFIALASLHNEFCPATH